MAFINEDNLKEIIELQKQLMDTPEVKGIISKLRNLSQEIEKEQSNNTNDVLKDFMRKHNTSEGQFSFNRNQNKVSTEDIDYQIEQLKKKREELTKQKEHNQKTQSNSDFLEKKNKIENMILKIEDDIRINQNELNEHLTDVDKSLEILRSIHNLSDNRSHLLEELSDIEQHLSSFR